MLAILAFFYGEMPRCCDKSRCGAGGAAQEFPCPKERELRPVNHHAMTDAEGGFHPAAPAQVIMVSPLVNGSNIICKNL
jgi:hypothetical protein